MHIGAIDFTRAAAFVASIPKGRWTAYKDVAEAGGNVKGAQVVGEWLRRRGHDVPHVDRVLTVDGLVPDRFRAGGPSVPKDASSVRELLRQEGVRIDSQGRAEQTQRFLVDDWV